MPVSARGTVYNMNGPQGAPVVVLIHGLGLTRGTTWAAFVPALARHYRVLTYDLIGHGDTAPPRGPVTLSDLSNQIIALMDELDIGRAALVGFSLGGMINRRCAMDHPDRVAALAILNSPHERTPERQKMVEQQARDADAGGPAATIDAALARWFTQEFALQRPETVARVRETVLANDPEAYAALRLVLAEGVVELIRPMPPIAHPTLVMTCEDDSGSTPEMSQAIATEIRGAELQVVAGLRHLGLIEQPQTFLAPLLDFLRRQLS